MSNNMKQSTGIEMNFLQSWEGWDSVDTFCMQFYQCKLKKHIAERLSLDSEKSYYVAIDCEFSKVTVYGYEEEDGDGELASFNFVCLMDV